MGPEDGRAQVPYDAKRAEAAIRELLLALGEDPEREGLKETPARVARAYAENMAGLYQSPREVLTTTFDIGHEELVIVRDIEVFSQCEHHLTPFHGVAPLDISQKERSPVYQKLHGWLMYLLVDHKFKSA